jgi:hypothetical protein
VTVNVQIQKHTPELIRDIDVSLIKSSTRGLVDRRRVGAGSPPRSLFTGRGSELRGRLLGSEPTQLGLINGRSTEDGLVVLTHQKVTLRSGPCCGCEEGRTPN